MENQKIPCWFFVENFHGLLVKQSKQLSPRAEVSNQTYVCISLSKQKTSEQLANNQLKGTITDKENTLVMCLSNIDVLYYPDYSTRTDRNMGTQTQMDKLSYLPQDQTVQLHLDSNHQASVIKGLNY